MFRVADYWPQPAQFQTIVNEFDGGIIQTYTAVPGGYRLRETNKGVWTDDWFYRIDGARGVLEYADDYPKTTALQKLMFWTPIVHQPMVPGKEIIWGNQQVIGDVIQGQCETAGIGGKFGWQRVDFLGLLPSFLTPAGTFNNVLMLRYWQTWDGDVSTKGATMWFAAGLGQIQVLWETAGFPTGYGMQLKSTSGLSDLVA